MTEESKTNNTAEETENKASTAGEQSMGAESKENTSGENKQDNAANTSDPLTELQAKYDSLNDKYLRLYSEFENYRRRTAKERLDTIRNAGADVVKELLPVVDDFDRALANMSDQTDPDSMREGFELIHNKLLRILQQQGLKPMDSMGKPFDTEYHEAITNIPAPEEDMKGKVVDVAEKGYFFHDTVLRYAKVVVGQ